MAHPYAKNYLGLTIAGGLLMGCAQYQAQQQEVQLDAAAQAQAAIDDAECRSEGTGPGSQAYVQCRLGLDNQHAQMGMQSRAIGNKIPGP
jgi:hypothetical protein